MVVATLLVRTDIVPLQTCIEAQEKLITLIIQIVATLLVRTDVTPL
jgi:hypothetical protein